MFSDKTVDPEVLLDGLNQGERDLMELIDDPETDRKEIKSEVRALVRISKK